MGYIEYDPETLNKLQDTLLEMLKDFDYVCTKYDIDYWGAGGTAIGAIRHNGIIPWDDDIDISYRRSDEQRIIEAVKQEFGDKYWFGNPNLIEGFPYIPTHMCLKDTEFKEKVYDDQNYPSGIFLDLYPYDDVFNDPKKAKRQILGAWFWGKLYVLYFASRPVLYFGGIKAKFIHLCCKLGNKFMHLLHVDPKKLYQKALNHCTACNNKEESTTMGWFFDPTPYTSLVKKKDIFPTQRLLFNNMKVKFPHDIDAYLSKRYGDYMALPPVEKRHNHPPEKLVFK